MRDINDYMPQPGRPGYIVLNSAMTEGAVDMDHYLVLRKCMICHKTSEVEVPAQGLWNWEHGEFVHKAFPQLTPEQREQIVTGTHAACWDAAFAEPDDGEDFDDEVEPDPEPEPEDDGVYWRDFLDDRGPDGL